MPSSNTTADDGVSSLHYPRTGKRGVPQQFPRRLYEMLQSESKFIQASAEHPKIIFWSESGKAFRIADVAEFSATILPKYFRTKKFSSFQRNLNLYGFAKVRRGPETDMYAHPSFVRDQEDTLSHLRKLTSTSSRRRTSALANVVAATSKIPNTPVTVTRSVSPSSPTLMLATAQFGGLPMPHLPLRTSHMIHKPTPSYASPQLTSVWAPIHNVPASPSTSSVSSETSNIVAADQSSCTKEVVGRGRLDLLALAMEQAAAMQ